MIFVFGSNIDGIHGAGAARTAVQEHGAVMGEGWGLFGNSFAIPTVNLRVQEPRHRIPQDRHLRKGPEPLRRYRETLSLAIVTVFIDAFLVFARQHPELQFQVTRIGCGLAGFEDHEIAPLFAEAPENCYFDDVWGKFLGHESHYNYWGTYDPAR